MAGLLVEFSVVSMDPILVPVSMANRMAIWKVHGYNDGLLSLSQIHAI